MIMPQEGRVKYPPRSYQTSREANPITETETSTRNPRREYSEFNSLPTREEPALLNYFFTNGLHSHNTSKPSPHSSMIDDWTCGSFAVGVGAGVIHILLADLNRNDRRVVMCFELLFYFTDVITFLCNAAIFTTQYIRNSRRMKITPDNIAKGSFVSLVPINLATIIIGSFRYGIASGWLQLNGAICWFHCYIILLISILTPYCLMWFRVANFLEALPTSFYLLPIPILLTGVMATHLLEAMPPESGSSINVLITGYLFEGVGMALALFYLCLYFFKVVLHGHGNGEQTVLSILVAGFPAFCAQTVISLGLSTRIIFEESSNMNLSAVLGEVWYGAGILVGVMLLGLSLAIIFITIANSWWKAANARSSLTSWMISTTCCSLAISSACSPVYRIFELQWLRATQLIFVAGGMISYLVILPAMILKYFKRISGRKRSASYTFTPARFALRGQDQPVRSAELRNLPSHHTQFTQRSHSNLAERSSVLKPHQHRHSGSSQATIAVNQNPKLDFN